MAVLVNLDSVTVTRGESTVLDTLRIGVAAGERVGVVGRNGAGKTTLLATLAGATVQAGRVTRTSGLRVGLLAQADTLDPALQVADLLSGRRGARSHAGLWRRNPAARGVVAGLGLEPLLERRVAELSGGERRRAALAALLTAGLDLLLLDEPTNHLDVEAVGWLAGHLAALAPGRAAVVVTHDRWFLDEVATTTWEVHDGAVEACPGGYSSYALARAERARLAVAEQARRANLLRKELAWLRRGAPARTSKPRYRVAAAEALVAGEPPPRDRAGLARFAAARLGRQVLELEQVRLVLGARVLLDDVTWRLGPGDRVALVGVNGSGKTSLLRVLAGELAPEAGVVRRGRTVRLGHLDQDGPAAPGAGPDRDVRLLASVEAVARVLTVGREELTAGALLERFGFPPRRHGTRVGDLSGGELRRLALLRLFAAVPNVVLLDEPTNDLDVDTLLALEDLLDHWAGALVVVSHDRWFLERVCDSTVALLGDGSLAALPGGVADYLTRRAAARQATAFPAATPGASTAASAATATRAARKEMARLERVLARLERIEADVHAELAARATDHEAVLALATRLSVLEAERTAAEESWLAAAERA